VWPRWQRDPSGQIPVDSAARTLHAADAGDGRAFMSEHVRPVEARASAREPSTDGARLWHDAVSSPERERRWLAILREQGVPVFARAPERKGAAEPVHVDARGGTGEPELGRASAREPSLDALDERAALGLVASLEPTEGDPQHLAVYPPGDTDPTWVDRRTMRIVRVPPTSLARERDVVRAADLADRVQLALGEPVLVRYGLQGDRPGVVALRPLVVRLRFTTASYRETAALVAGASTLAPLSIDALARALRKEGDRGEEPRVRRLFGRAYRLVDAHHTPWAAGQRESPGALRDLLAQGPARLDVLLARGTARVDRLARMGRDVAFALSEAEAFRAQASSALARLERVRLSELDRRDLLAALAARMRWVTDALGLLERSRLATLALLPALEAVCGRAPRELFDVLAAPQRTDERAQIDRRLVRLAERSWLDFGELRLPPRGSAPLEEAWYRALRELKHVRILGMDVRPQVMGASDEDLRQAVEEAVALQRGEVIGRDGAKNALFWRAARGPLGGLGVAPLGAVLVLLDRLARAKGLLAEGLAAALLSLRSAALEAGRRLVAQGILERPEDTLYMPLDEIEEALEGELGAYAARVRLRREDDRRWRNFAAPRWIEARAP
jgi:hypothetical protein